MIPLSHRCVRVSHQLQESYARVCGKEVDERGELGLGLGLKHRGGRQGELIACGGADIQPKKTAKRAKDDPDSDEDEKVRVSTTDSLRRCKES